VTIEQQIDRALTFFTDEEHTDSFELLEGAGCTLFSAPHAVLQTRNGSVKCAERFTGMLCQILHSQMGCPVIYKTRHLRDDANHDPISDYRDALCQYVKRQGIGYVFDLHQMKPEREIDVCLGTGYGAHLVGHMELTALVEGRFRKQGIRNITVDEPFASYHPSTVSATVAARCHIPAIQLEINTRLLMRGYEDYCFERVLEALRGLADDLGYRRTDKIAL